LEAIARYFKFAERGTDFATEVRAGLTTFLVMAYIIFLNPIILRDGFKAVSGYDLDVTAAAATTALIAGLLTIAMGVITNYPFAMAAGLGLNAIVAFGLTSQGLSPQGAMGVIVLEGVAILVLVVLGLREAIMNAVPLALKRAIGVGIGLFILFIGFWDAKIIQIPASNATPVELVLPTTPAHFVFFLGLALTIGLWVLRVRGALLISILVTAAVAVLVGVQPVPQELTLTPSFFPLTPHLGTIHLRPLLPLPQLGDAVLHLVSRALVLCPQDCNLRVESRVFSLQVALSALHLLLPCDGLVALVGGLRQAGRPGE